MKERIELVKKKHPKLSVRIQCKLLGVARFSLTYEAVAESPENIRIQRHLDELYLIDPCLGSRRLVTVLDRKRLHLMGHLKSLPQHETHRPSKNLIAEFTEKKLRRPEKSVYAPYTYI